MIKIKIKEFKEQKGFTVAELAEKSGMPKRTLEDIMRRNDCMVSNAIKIADALGVSLDELCKPD